MLSPSFCYMFEVFYRFVLRRFTVLHCYLCVRDGSWRPGDIFYQGVTGLALGLHTFYFTNYLKVCKQCSPCSRTIKLGCFISD